MKNDATDLSLFLQQCDEVVTHLIDCRKSAKLTQQQLAEWVGTYRERIVRFETSNQLTDFELLFAIAEKFGVKISLLFTES